MPLGNREGGRARKRSQDISSDEYRFPADIIHWGNDSQQFVGRSPYNEETLLFDIESDYAQEYPLHDEALERHCIEQMKRCMATHDALPEQYERLGI